jgi:predicted 3-demethylubiquinone-9 3-methyltransferase (glyoxalase superfamily)
MSKITPFLWFDDQAEEAAEFYTSVFERSHVVTTAGPAGRVMTVAFELDGQPFLALNGGPEHYRFNESISFLIDCSSQDEVDHYWSRLSDGGEEGPCGWLKDRFGLSWQVVPSRLPELLGDPDAERAARVMQVMMGMKKLDVALLEAAAAGD